MPEAPDPQLESSDSAGLMQTAVLLKRARGGDRNATDDLMLRYQASLQRFMHARLSPSARRFGDTQDGVQEVLLRAWKKIDEFEYRGVGSFWFYLRTIARNFAIRANQRAHVNAAIETIAADSHHAPAAQEDTPLQRMLGRESLDSFEKAIEVLTDQQRSALLMRLELDLGYAEIAAECGYPSNDAARMGVSRALERVAREMTGAQAPEASA